MGELQFSTIILMVIHDQNDSDCDSAASYLGLGYLGMVAMTLEGWISLGLMATGIALIVLSLWPRP